MFRLYAKFRPIDWLLVAVLLAVTVLQVWFTMLLVDRVRDLIATITYLDYRNDPGKISEALAAAVAESGWSGVPGAFLENETVARAASASVADVWSSGGRMLLTALGGTLCQATVSLIASVVSSSLTTRIRSDIYGKVSTFSAAEINRFSTPSLITRATNDVQQVQMANVNALRLVVAAPVTAIWAVLKIRATSYELTFASAVAVIVIAAGVFAVMAVVVPKFRLVQRLTDRLNGVTRDNLTGMRVVRAYNAEDHEREKFAEVNDRITRLHIFTGTVMALMSPLMSLVMNGVSLAMYWIGASLINRGTTDYATVTSFMMLASQIISAFMMLTMLFAMIPRAQVSAGRINEVLSSESSVRDPSDPVSFAGTGTIEFRNVSFSYPDAAEPAIEGLSFKVDKGQTLAFIGATGSGKTTAVDLIARFYDATEGEVLVDGVNVKDVRQSDLRRRIGFVPQKSVLFSGTVAENISFASPDMTREEIVSAARIAEADEFVASTEGGYDARVSQGGNNFSGGQKQRLSIARAVAARPEILVFDDSFSALDYKTDKKIRSNLSESLGSVTKVIVAQRVGTIVSADKIIVLDGGRAVGVGTHSELLRDCPVYREIASSQLGEGEVRS